MEKGKELRLHLGCGEVYLPGYLNIDFPPAKHTVQRTSKADFYADITELSYPRESIAEIRLHHVFEHFSRATALRLLIQWYLWLEERGRLVIETPDFKRSVRRIISPFCPLDERMLLIRHIFGSQEARWAMHQDGWDAVKFKLFLSRLGFRRIRFTRSQWRGTFNITVEA